MNKSLWRNHLQEYIATGFFRHIMGEDWDALQEHRNFMLFTTEEALWDLAGVCKYCGKPQEACECRVTFEKALTAMRACHKAYLRDNPDRLLYLDTSRWFPQPVICVFGQDCPETGIPKVWHPTPWDLTSTKWRIK